jgi:hypothetical protein
VIARRPFYDDAVLLHHVGFTSAVAEIDRAELTRRLEGLIEPPALPARRREASRWSDGRESEWYPLKPALVVEVRFDQVTGDRFRHGAGLVRWRPDKAPTQCRKDGLDYALRPSELSDIAPCSAACSNPWRQDRPNLHHVVQRGRAFFKIAFGVASLICRGALEVRLAPFQRRNYQDFLGTY